MLAQKAEDDAPSAAKKAKQKGPGRPAGRSMRNKNQTIPLQARIDEVFYVRVNTMLEGRYSAYGNTYFWMPDDFGAARMAPKDFAHARPERRQGRGLLEGSEGEPRKSPQMFARRGITIISSPLRQELRDSYEAARALAKAGSHRRRRPFTPS